MINFEILGHWTPYKKEVPVGWPPNTIFFRNENGDDWYEFWFPYIKKADPNDLFMTAIQSSEGYLTQAVQRDPSMIIPSNSIVVRISGHTPEDPLPHKSYEQRIFNPETLTLTARPPQIPAAVFDYQFAGQAAAEKIIGEDDALAWITTGVIPETLVEAVKQAVPDPERQGRVLMFLAGTTSFPRFHELTPLLAGAFGKDTPEKVDAFFIAASKR